MDEILELREKYVNNPVQNLPDTAQQLIDDEIDKTEKMVVALKKLHLLDEKLKKVIQEEKIVKAKSLEQQRKTFAELVSIDGKNRDTRTNIERYLSLLPASATASAVPSIKSESEIGGDNIFYQTQFLDSERASTIGNEDFGESVSGRLSGLDLNSNSQIVDKSSSKSSGDFVKRNVELAKNASATDYGVLMTEDEQKRIEQLLLSDNDDSESEDEDIVSQLPNNRLPAINDASSIAETSTTCTTLAHKFLPDVDRIKLRDVESRLSVYQSERRIGNTGVTVDISDTCSVYSEQLSRIDDNQAKMNFINGKLRQARTEPQKTGVLSSDAIENLLSDIRAQKTDILNDYDSDDTEIDDDRITSSIDRSVLDQLLETAKRELNLVDEENDQETDEIEHEPVKTKPNNFIPNEPQK